MKENKKLEFKESISDTFLKTVSAFSNYDGGTILFGVNDLGKEVGIKNIKENVIKIENKINDSIDPQVNYDIEVDDERSIIRLNIKPGSYTPYFYKSKTYRRNDTSTIEVDKMELKRLILQGDNKSFDSLIVGRKDVKYSYLEKKFNEILGVESVDNDVLKSLELLDKNNNITNAGNLFSDNNNKNIVDVVRFGKNHNIILNRYQIKRGCLLEAYDRCISIYKDQYIIEVIDGAYRNKVELIPEKAFREALANSLVHRDWMSDSFIQISMDDEWITITSPGGLPEEISESEYLEGRISKMRNPIIGNIFFRLDIIESFGTGIKRIKESYNNSHKKPIFRVFENSIEVNLPVISKIDKLNEDQKIVYLSIENKEKASSEIAKETGFGKNKVLDIINNLMDNGYVKKVGRGRGTKYLSR